MTILDKIVAHKKGELEKAKAEIPLRRLEEMPCYARTCYSLKENLVKEEKTGIIAEFKRKSPSKKNINLSADLPSIVKGYENANVAGISVLTDTHFFGGSLKDLSNARQFVHIPILRKDFMIDPYQVHEAKAYGADVILLIANILTTEETRKLATLAHQVGMEVLLEIDKKEQINTHVMNEVDVVGVNNRNLKTFQTTIGNSLELIHSIPDTFARISESGIHNVKDAHVLLNEGFDGLLMGQKFMQEQETVKACEHFIQELNTQQYVS
jgi:indole-3-glycerol phosphate synthase